jgi:hypothetical protein
MGAIISDALTLAARRPVVGAIAGRFPLDGVVDAYRALDSLVPGKVLVLPQMGLG